MNINMGLIDIIDRLRGYSGRELDARRATRDAITQKKTEAKAQKRAKKELEDKLTEGLEKAGITPKVLREARRHLDTKKRLSQEVNAVFNNPQNPNRTRDALNLFYSVKDIDAKGIVKFASETVLKFTEYLKATGGIGIVDEDTKLDRKSFPVEAYDLAEEIPSLVNLGDIVSGIYSTIEGSACATQIQDSNMYVLDLELIVSTIVSTNDDFRRAIFARRVDALHESAEKESDEARKILSGVPDKDHERMRVYFANLEGDLVSGGVLGKERKVSAGFYTDIADAQWKRKGDANLLAILREFLLKESRASPVGTSLSLVGMGVPSNEVRLIYEHLFFDDSHRRYLDGGSQEFIEARRDIVLLLRKVILDLDDTTLEVARKAVNNVFNGYIESRLKSVSESVTKRDFRNLSRLDYLARVVDEKQMPLVLGLHLDAVKGIGRIFSPRAYELVVSRLELTKDPIEAYVLSGRLDLLHDEAEIKNNGASKILGELSQDVAEKRDTFFRKLERSFVEKGVLDGGNNDRGFSDIAEGFLREISDDEKLRLLKERLSTDGPVGIMDSFSDYPKSYVGVLYEDLLLNYGLDGSMFGACASDDERFLLTLRVSSAVSSASDVEDARSRIRNSYESFMNHYIQNGIEIACSRDSEGMAHGFAHRGIEMARALGKLEDVKKKLEESTHGLVGIKAYSPARGIAKALNLQIDIPNQDDHESNSEMDGGTVSLG